MGSFPGSGQDTGLGYSRLVPTGLPLLVSGRDDNRARWCKAALCSFPFSLLRVSGVHLVIVLKWVQPGLGHSLRGWGPAEPEACLHCTVEETEVWRGKSWLSGRSGEMGL